MIIVLLNLEVRGRAGWSTAELFPSIEMNVPRHGVACATMRVTDRPQPESKWRLSGFTYEDQSKKRGVISAIRAYGQIVAQRIRTGNSVFSLNPIGKGVEVHKFKKVVSEEFEEPNNSYATDVSDALFYDFPSPDWVLGRR